MTAPDIRVRDVLTAVFDGLEDYVEVRCLAPDGAVEQSFVPVGDWAPLEAFVLPRRERTNCYVGAATRRAPGSGALANCGALPALYVDLDFAGGHHADEGLPSEEGARQRLADCPLPPSLVVHTGGGLHAYWLLEEAIDLGQHADQAKALLRRLVRALDADPAAAEPARVLRLPRTFNHKFEPPKLVTVEVFEPTRRYAVSAFESWLPEEPEPRRDPRVVSGPTPDTIPAGGRNAFLTSLAGTMRKRGMSPAALVAALVAENQARCRPPLTEAEVRRIASSVGRYQPDPAASGASALACPLPELVARAADRTEPAWLVSDLIPGDGTVLLHGQPREYKTLAAQAILLAVTTGQAAFHLERLRVPAAVPGWYLTEEDSWYRVATRFEQLGRGYGLPSLPDRLSVTAGQGLDLDAPEWQERTIATARELGAGLVVIDPVRSLTAHADQGPNELKPFALFLRRFIRQTGAVVLLVHHDTKPPATGQDQRRRPQRASGGGIFSIADAPIHIDRVDETRRLLVPDSFKFSADPKPVTIRLEHGTDSEGLGWIRLLGDESTDALPDAAVLDAKILAYLAHSPGSYGNKVAVGVQARKEDVLARLRSLEERGLVDRVKASRGDQWFCRRVA